ncbi:hypothetical protein PG999_014286 [Apiospora kogelbergensis]|uniref:CRISPR type III-B/RAMP module-associated protein Cmr5 n=1 Tax=Apiospora kogelbergensis TaxID=1337665 RepID=A0AAW0Q6Y3_9PEZI
MPHLNICFRIDVWYQVGTLASKLHFPISDDDHHSQPVPVPQDTHSRFWMQIRGSTDLMSGSNACSADEAKVTPCNDDDALSGHVKLDIVLTELLPRPDSTTTQDTLNSTSAGTHSNCRLPGTSRVELGHRHFRGPDYETMLAMNHRDLASYAMQAHRRLAKQMHIKEGEAGFRPLVQEALGQMVKGPVKSRPETDDVWLRGLDACVSRADEALYIEAFNRAWVHLYETCVKNEKSRGDQRGTEGQGSGERQ